MRYIDIQLDYGENAFTRFDDGCAAAVREACERQGLHLGLHTLSAINVAEYSPLLSEAVDECLKACIDISPKLGARWIVVHAGYHFTADVKPRMEAGLERLNRMADYAERKGARLLPEDLNKEPADAEVHYLAHTLEEWACYYDRIDSPAFALSFTANHAHLSPEGIPGFVDAIPWQRAEEVRLADCFRSGHEIHLPPGEGDLDFPDMFHRIEATGFKGHDMNGFGTLEDIQKARCALADGAQAGLA